MRTRTVHTVDIGPQHGKETILRAIAEVDRLLKTGQLRRISIQDSMIFAYSQPWASNLEVLYQIRLPFDFNRKQREPSDSGPSFTPTTQEDNWVLSYNSEVIDSKGSTMLRLFSHTFLFDWLNEVVRINTGDRLQMMSRADRLRLIGEDE